MWCYSGGVDTLPDSQVLDLLSNAIDSFLPESFLVKEDPQQAAKDNNRERGDHVKLTLSPEHPRSLPPTLPLSGFPKKLFVACV